MKHILISGWNEHGGLPGMMLLRFDEEKGSASYIKTEEEKLSCNCTYYDEEKEIIYITNEVHNNPDYPKGGGGLLYAFKFDKEKETFAMISRVESSCPCPAFISLDKTKKYLLCANHSSFNAVTKAVKGKDGYYHTKVLYDDAIVGLYKLFDDGRIGPLIDVKKHDRYKVIGRGLHSHPHNILMSPDGSFHVCTDKGDGHIYLYKVDYEKEKLVLLNKPYKDYNDASPRYAAFHKTKKWLFINHEKDLNLSSFSYDDRGNLKEIDRVKVVDNIDGLKVEDARKLLHNETILPPDDGIWPLEQQGLVISNDSKYLYDCINGVDAISVIEINQENGTLKLKQVLPLDGTWIRGCALSNDGKYLFVTALQRGGFFIYKINEDGTLGELTTHLKDVLGGSYITVID